MKKKPLKISIVTPSFNQEKFLERTIRSVIDQQYPNLEYIVIDGGSTDKSPRIIQKYQKHLAYWVSEPDRGQADAINKGFTQATGEVMAWLNSDDILMPDSLEFINMLFQHYSNIEWLTGQSISIDQHDRIVHTGLHTGKIQSLLKAGLYHGKALGFIGQEGTFWRKKLWDKAGGYIDDHQYALDYYLWKRFAHYASLVSVETPLAAFRIHPNQKTRDLRPYYQEIHPLWNLVPKKITLVARALHPLILRRAAPRIYYDQQQHDWLYNRA